MNLKKLCLKFEAKISMYRRSVKVSKCQNEDPKNKNRNDENLSTIGDLALKNDFFIKKKNGIEYKIKSDIYKISSVQNDNKKFDSVSFFPKIFAV